MSRFPLGRRPAQDPESQDHRYDVARMRLGGVHLLGNVDWPPPIDPATGLESDPLEQGDTGECVGFGTETILACSPESTRPASAAEATAIYMRATLLDSDPSNDGDPQAGAESRCGMLAARRMGLIKTFGRAFSISALRRWLAGVDATGKPLGGPAGIGIPWFESMFDVGADGLIRVDRSSGVAGGHWICVRRFDRATGRYRLRNTWGRMWGEPSPDGGLSGEAWLSEGDLVTLVYQLGGETFTVLERAA